MAGLKTTPVRKLLPGEAAVRAGQAWWAGNRTYRKRIDSWQAKRCQIEDRTPQVGHEGGLRAGMAPGGAALQVGDGAADACSRRPFFTYWLTFGTPLVTILACIYGRGARGILSTRPRDSGAPALSWCPPGPALLRSLGSLRPL